MLTLNKISYRWPGAATDCLCDISLQLKQGEWLALTGDNGAGKSTTFKAVLGLICCQLADTANSHPLDLHSAQRRMVAVACLEALSPPLFLLDEPSRDFDENWLSVFESWLEKCGQRGTSVVAISHDAAFTRRHFSRVVRLEDGLIRNVNPPDDIHP